MTLVLLDTLTPSTVNEASDAAAAEAQLAEVCEKFLTNPVIEDAKISVVETAGAS